jgi:hypothetical protein
MPQEHLGYPVPDREADHDANRQCAEVSFLILSAWMLGHRRLARIIRALEWIIAKAGSVRILRAARGRTFPELSY